MEIKVNNYKLRIDEENLEKISSGNKLIYSPHWQNYLEVVESKKYAGKLFKNLGISPAQAMDFAMLGGKDGKIEYYIIYILPGERSDFMDKKGNRLSISGRNFGHL